MGGAIKRGNDAGDHTQAATDTAKTAHPDARQDGANYETRTDGGQAIEVENLSSGNDEGAP